MHGQKPKSCRQPGQPAPPPLKKKSLSDRGPAAQNRYITSTPYVFNHYIYTMYNDLTVRNGRLINNRPNDVTGIQQAAQIKKDLKREQKISMMEEAMYRAEMRSNMMESLMEMKKK
jgi:hypothetical protein